MGRRTLLKSAVVGAMVCAFSGALALTLSSAAQEPVPAVAAPASGKITPESWTEMVGFKPDMSQVKVSAGGVVHKGNVDQAKGLLPPGLEKLVRKYELKIRIAEYTPIHPSLPYIAATQANVGKTKVWDVGADYRKLGMQGYVAGLPFPKPKDGMQVAWNYLGTYTGDDGDRLYDATWISARSGLEHTEHWRWASIRTVNRTDIDPRPEVSQFSSERTASASITYAIEPYDKQGFGALYFRSIDPVDVQGHVYVPAMRRVLRNSFGTRGDTWNATDYLYEDVGGYLGAVEWMNWKLVGQKTMLMPVNAGAKHSKDVKVNFDVDAWPHWNPKVNWQPRPVYVLEVKPKFPDYPYSRMLIVVDAETFTIPYKEAYDKKGELWKIIINAANKSPDMNAKPLDPGVSVAIDLQAEHATAITFRKFVANSNLDPNLFTLSSLRKRGH